MNVEGWMLQHGHLSADRFFQVPDPAVVVAVDRPVAFAVAQVYAVPVSDTEDLGVVGDINDGPMRAKDQDALELAGRFRGDLPPERQARPHDGLLDAFQGRRRARRYRSRLDVVDRRSRPKSR